MSNVPIPTLGPTGFVAPSEAAILTGAFADWQEAFDGTLNPDLTTPQGQLATSEASIIGQYNDLFLLYVALVDPAFTSGRMQDAIARIYFLSRRGSLPTTVQVVCTGASGTLIPAGSLVAAADGTVYQSTDDATIGTGGTVTVNFEAVTDGPTAAPAHTITTIQRAVPGWDSVDNPAPGVPGRATETARAMEARRAASVSLNATGILPAIRGALLNTDDVLDAYVTENATGSTATIGGVSIAAHSLYVSVLGGSDADVARAIWLKKSPGASYVGTTTVTVQDTGSGYGLPYPSYDVKFTRAAGTDTFFAIEIADMPDVPSDAVAQIRAAIAAAYVGDDGGPRAAIGSTQFASRFYAPVASLGPWARIMSLKIGKTDPATQDSITFDIDEAPTVDEADIDVTFV